MSPGYIRGLRELVGRRLLLVPSVAVVAHDGQGRLLLVRDRESGVWGLPAGAVEPGESPSDAARREFVEETGVAPGELTLVGAVGGAEFRHTYPNGDPVEYQIFVFAARVDAVGAPGDPGEIAEVRFFSRGEAPSLPLPYPDHLLWGPWPREST